MIIYSISEDNIKELIYMITSGSNDSDWWYESKIEEWIKLQNEKEESNS